MKTFYKPFLAGFLTTAAILTGSGARAQEAPTGNRHAVSGRIAAGVATVPDYEGAKDQRVIPLLAGDIHWGERYFAIEGTSARLNLLNSRAIEFGPVANLTFGRDAKAKP
ncbi:MAG: MipA/OmpV family protein, partial [Sphingomonas sp.]|nr:MipA/OmpV family protein [Sphingomonas sp.]